MAWDVYLLFDPKSPWADPAPEPQEWFHQLGGLDDHHDRFRTALDLVEALSSTAEERGWPSQTNVAVTKDWQSTRTDAMARLAPVEGDDRCATCTELGRLSSCSLAGWRRILLQREEGGRFAASGTQPSSEAAGRRVVHLVVHGLECPECLLRVSAGALAVAAVEEVELGLDDGRMRVLLSPGAIVEDARLVDVVEGQGFAAELIANLSDS